MIRSLPVTAPSWQHAFRVVLAMLFLHEAAAAQQAGAAASSKISKPAWEWSVDERLAKRFNPQAIKARAEEQAAEMRAFEKRFPGSTINFPERESQGLETARQVVDTIRGAKNPELFLVSELFDQLLAMGFPPDGAGQRESRSIVEERAVALGFGRDLWSRLEKATAPFLKLQRQNERLSRARSLPSRPVDDFGMDSESIRWCRTRAKAIAAAKTEFGEEPFLRLLYTGVTPGFSLAYVVKEGIVDHLRIVEGGCQ